MQAKATKAAKSRQAAAEATEVESSDDVDDEDDEIVIVKGGGEKNPTPGTSLLTKRTRGTGTTTRKRSAAHAARW